MADRTRVRQGEYGRRTFLVLIASTALAAIAAIAGFLYVESQPPETLAEPLIADPSPVPTPDDDAATVPAGTDETAGGTAQ